MVIPPLPCPECRMSGRGGGARIGNHRSRCPTCNRFAQSVRRRTLKLFMARHEEEFGTLRLAVELELYPGILAEFLEASSVLVASS